VTDRFYSQPGADPLSDLARDAGKLSQLPDVTLALAVIQVARAEAIGFDQAAVKVLDALHELREARKAWRPPPGYRAQDLPRDRVQQLMDFVIDMARTVPAHSGTDTRAARALLERLGISWREE
jgi:hypothetical protein